MKKAGIYIFNMTSRASKYGIGTYIHQLISILKESGWDFTIVNLHADEKEVKLSNENSYRQIDIPCPDVQIKDASLYYNRNIVYLLKEWIPEDKTSETIFHLNFMGNKMLVKYMRKNFRCKIIQVAHYTDWSFSLMGDYKKLKKLYSQPLKKLTALDKAILHSVKNDLKVAGKVDKIVCVAQHTLNSFCGLDKFPESKTEIINNALQDSYKHLSIEEKQQLKKKYFIGDKEKIIVFAGRLDEVKGVNYLIEAYRKTIEKHSDTRLFIAGNGNIEELLNTAADCRVKITFTGRLEQQKLYELYSIADMGVVCSLHEEFGFVAIEMMMHALPLIVTKTGGLDEIVEDNVSGLKVPVRTIKGKRQADVKLLQEKICLLLENPAQASELGENARKRFLEKYELSIFKGKMLNLYLTI